MMLIYIKCKKDKKKDIPCDSLTENIYAMSTNNTSFTKGIRI